MTIMGCSGGASGGTCGFVVPSPSPTDTSTPPGPTESPSQSPSPSPTPEEVNVFVHNAYSAHRVYPEELQPGQQRQVEPFTIEFVESSFSAVQDISTITPKRVTPPEPTSTADLTDPSSPADATPNAPTGILVDEYYSGATPGTPVPSMTVPLLVVHQQESPTPSMVSYRPNVPYAVYWNNDVIQGIWKFEYDEYLKNVDNDTNPKSIIPPPTIVSPTQANTGYPYAVVDVNQDVPLTLAWEADTGVLVQVYSNPVTNGAEQGAQPHFESCWTNVDVTSLNWADPDSVDAFLNSLPDTDSVTIPAGVMKTDGIGLQNIVVVVSTYKKGHVINRDPPFPSINYAVSRLFFPMTGEAPE